LAFESTEKVAYVNTVFIKFLNICLIFLINISTIIKECELIMTKLDILVNDFNKKLKEELFTKGKVIQKCAQIPFSSPRVNYYFMAVFLVADLQNFPVLKTQVKQLCV
jgi:hypothetical protein